MLGRAGELGCGVQAGGQDGATRKGLEGQLVVTPDPTARTPTCPCPLLHSTAVPQR